MVTPALSHLLTYGILVSITDWISVLRLAAVIPEMADLKDEASIDPAVWVLKSPKKVPLTVLIEAAALAALNSAYIASVPSTETVMAMLALISALPLVTPTTDALLIILKASSTAFPFPYLVTSCGMRTPMSVVLTVTLASL